MSFRSTPETDQDSRCSNAALGAGSVSSPNRLDLPPEVRQMIYTLLLEPYLEDDAFDKQEYHYIRVRCAPNAIAICWDAALIDDLAGFVLASKTCYEDFQSFLPAITMCMYEDYYQDLMIMPELFREKVASLVLRDGTGNHTPTKPYSKDQLTRARCRLKWFPQLTVIEVHVRPLIYCPEEMFETVVDRERTLLRCR